MYLQGWEYGDNIPDHASPHDTHGEEWSHALRMNSSGSYWHDWSKQDWQPDQTGVTHALLHQFMPHDCANPSINSTKLDR